MNVQVGNWVRHYGTRMWGQVEYVQPMRDGTKELLVLRDSVYSGDPPGRQEVTWWATYHVDCVLDHEPTTKLERNFPRAWRPLGGLG